MLGLLKKMSMSCGFFYPISTLKFKIIKRLISRGPGYTFRKLAHADSFGDNGKFFNSGWEA